MKPLFCHACDGKNTELEGPSLYQRRQQPTSALAWHLKASLYRCSATAPRQPTILNGSACMQNRHRLPAHVTYSAIPSSSGGSNRSNCSGWSKSGRAMIPRPIQLSRPIVTANSGTSGKWLRMVRRWKSGLRALWVMSITMSWISSASDL